MKHTFHVVFVDLPFWHSLDVAVAVIARAHSNHFIQQRFLAIRHTMVISNKPLRYRLRLRRECRLLFRVFLPVLTLSL